VRSTVVLAAIVLAACGSDPASPDAGARDLGTEAGTNDAEMGIDAPRPPRDAGTGRVDAAPDGGEPPPTDTGPRGLPDVGATILERPSSGEFACVVDRSAMNLAPRRWFGVEPTHTLVESGTTTWSLRREDLPAMPFDPIDVKLVLSTFSPTLELGVSRVISEQQAGSIFAAQNADGFAAVWTATSVRIARFDRAGAPIGPSVALPSTFGTVQGRGSPKATLPILAAQPDGYGVAYGWRDSLSDQAKLFFLPLDARGREAGPPVQIAQNGAPYRAIHGKIVATEDGYAIVWALFVVDRSEVFFARLDRQGRVTRGPIQLSNASGEGFSSGGETGFAAARLALIRRGEGFVAAWTETYEEKSIDTFGYSIVRIAELEADGSLRSTPQPLQRPERDIDHTEPVIMPFGDRTAVLWSRGSHIILCAGCVPNHAIQMVLLDPGTLSPVSEVVSLPPAESGLIGYSSAVSGSKILLTFKITFHVYDTPGAGAFRCDAL
jgi:hypothetical protein